MTQYSGKVIRKTPVTPTQTSASGVWKLNEQAAAIRNNSWPVPGVPDPISRSVRLRSSASAYLNRTPASSTNRTTWTWSGWVKFGSLSAYGHLFAAYQGSSPSDTNYFRLFVPGPSNNQMYVGGGVTNWLITTQVFRDPSAWYHVVLAVDTTQATASNRLKLYINGLQVTSFSTASYPAQNATLAVNANWAHAIGAEGNLTANYFDGYLTEINFVDGQALTPSSFGTTDTATGAWIPMPYTGTYGANGFYLNFKDNTSTTTLGYDYSGNSNNWTANNISLTAGVTYDSMLDVPTPWVGYSTTTDTSAVTRGNYAVLNATWPAATGVSLSWGNLRYTNTSASANQWYASITALDTNIGWYYEATCTTRGASDQYNYVGDGNALYATNGQIYMGGSLVTTVATYTSGDVIGVAFGGSFGLKFYKNGTQVYSASASGGNGLIVNGYNSCVWDLNFGQRPFSYTPPTGAKTICTTNLPTPTITNGANYMAASLYTGNGTSQSINNSVNGVSFQPDFVWVKNRSAAYNHCLSNTNVGITYSLSSNLTDAEVNYGNISAVTSTGFSVNGNQLVNGSGNALVGWQWKAGAGTTSSNTSGSITSTVCVGATQGFSVVTYTGNATANATVGHGLGVAPKMILIKSRSSVTDWNVYNANLTTPNDQFLRLNTTDAASTASGIFSTPTSTVFGFTSAYSSTNANGVTYVAYCWAAVAGYSAFGSYTGNGSADGPFIYCGFRPRWVMVKWAGGVENWAIIDTARSPSNAVITQLFANQSWADNTDANQAVDILSNGFKPRGSLDLFNRSGGSYIYAAFAENPFKYSNAR